MAPPLKLTDIIEQNDKKNWQLSSFSFLFPLLNNGPLKRRPAMIGNHPFIISFIAKPG